MHMELQARLGRGFVRSDVNKRMYQNEGQPLGIIYTDDQKAIIEPYIQDYMSNNDEDVLTLSLIHN